ncbi:MAG: hypothetical protein L0154_11770 [Chloroflexi bacterium]|nr:hypothetical protein [Chloroflexota bacterium]
MIRWLSLLPLLFLLTLVSIVDATRREPAPKIISVYDFRYGQYGTIINETLDGRYQKAIHPGIEQWMSGIDWSPDGTWILIRDNIGNYYHYEYNSQRLEHINNRAAYYRGKLVRWSSYDSDFFILSTTQLLIFRDGRWVTFNNGRPEIEEAFWVGDRIVFTDLINGMTSIAGDGTDRVVISTKFYRLIGVYDGAAYTYSNHTLYKVDILSGVSQPVITFQPESETMAISPDGQYLVYVGQGDTPHLINLETEDDEPLIQGPVSNRIDGFIWSPDGEHILIYHNNASYSGNWSHIDLDARHLSQLRFYAGYDEVSWKPTQNLNWHPLRHVLGAVFILIAKIGLRIMV